MNRFRSFCKIIKSEVSRHAVVIWNFWSSSVSSFLEFPQWYRWSGNHFSVRQNLSLQTVVRPVRPVIPGAGYKTGARTWYQSVDANYWEDEGYSPDTFLCSPLVLLLPELRLLPAARPEVQGQEFRREEMLYSRAALRSRRGRLWLSPRWRSQWRPQRLQGKPCVWE